MGEPGQFKIYPNTLITKKNLTVEYAPPFIVSNEMQRIVKDIENMYQKNMFQNNDNDNDNENVSNGNKNNKTEIKPKIKQKTILTNLAWLNDIYWNTLPYTKANDRVIISLMSLILLQHGYPPFIIHSFKNYIKYI